MVSENSRLLVNRDEYGTVTRTIPLFGGEIREGEAVKILARYKDSAGNELLSIKSGLECNGVTADRVVVKPSGLPF